MLRKRSRPFQRDHSRSQLMADLASDSSDKVLHRPRGPPFFTVPGLFVAKPTDSSSDSAAGSPTSPLDCRPFSVNSPRSPAAFDVGHPRSWDCNRVGLSLVDSLNRDVKPLGSSESNKSILFGSQMRTLLQSPPPKFEVGSSSSSSFPRARGYYFYNLSKLSKSSSDVFEPTTAGNGSGLISSLSASDIELSEDYTCIISHGPNPKTTHIFGDCVLDGDSIARSLDCKNNKADDFLSRCFYCKKRLELGEDIYMYRGEKAFCSTSCRDHEIFLEEEAEKKPESEIGFHRLGSSFREEIFMALAS